MEVYNKFKKDLLCCMTIYWILMIIVGGFDRDTTDGEVRSGMALKIDALTGCHYLEGQRGGLTPRLDKEGLHICEGH